jgi:hypothetical protein
MDNVFIAAVTDKHKIICNFNTMLHYNRKTGTNSLSTSCTRKYIQKTFFFSKWMHQRNNYCTLCVTRVSMTQSI